MLFGKYLFLLLKQKGVYFILLFLRLACQCLSIILQLTESEKNNLISLHMDEQTNEENMLKYNLRSNSSNKDYLKSYIPDPDQYTTVEEVSLSIVGPPTQVKH